MTITQIRYFLDVTRFKSFTKAANHNFVVQQVVSRQVKRLEDELGFPLFDRSKNTITLTPGGEKLAEIWDEMLTRQLEVIREMRKEADSRGRRVRIGTFAVSRIYDFVSEAIAETAGLLPETEFQVETDSFRGLHQKLMEGQLDMIVSLRDENRELSETFESIDLVNLIPAIILSENHPLYQEGRILTTADLEGEIVYYPSADFAKNAERNISRHFAELSVHPKKMIGMEELPSLEMALYSGQGIAMTYMEFFRNPFGKLHAYPAMDAEIAKINHISLTVKKKRSETEEIFAKKLIEHFENYSAFRKI